MNPKLSDLTFILDRSGSMKSIRDAAIRGFNEFLRTQQNIPGQARLTLIQFDDQYEVWAKALPLDEVVPLNENTYQPRGNTALLDAIGRTIDETGERLASLPEHERPGKVIMAIMTDGMENASRRFTVQDVSTRIAHQRDKYGWEFLFLGANQDAIATAASLNIRARDSATYLSSYKGSTAAYAAISSKITALREAAQGNPQYLEDLRAEMSELLKKEMKKQKKKEDQA